MMSKRRKIVWVVALLVLGTGVFAFVRYRQAHRQPEIRFETAKVERGRIVARVTATGTLSALVTVQVGSQVSGRIKEILVDFNSPVKKGQVLARIDPQLFQAAVAQARANHVAAQGDLTTARARAVDAERQYMRNQSLRERKLIAQADLDTAQANAEVARAQVEGAEGKVAQARASLHEAEVNLAYTIISSPIDGIVVSRNVDVGQTVAASLQAPTLFVLAEDLRRMQVDTSVAEADIGRLRPGMAASFTVDAYPTERFTGTVRQIRNAPQTVQNVVTYDAVIDVQNADLRLKPGMTANVALIYADKDDVLRVRNAALRFRPSPELLAKMQGGQAPPQARESGPRDQRSVWVLRGDEPEPVLIRTGVTDGTVTEVVEGDLREGDPLVTEATGQSSRAQPAGGGVFRF
jgi:HlyD family secretion protein